jgi:transaldolase
MNENPLRRVHALGQSLWLDYIRRHLIKSGELRQIIEEDGLCGVTSNPDIFDKAIADSQDHDDAIGALALKGKSVEEIYQSLSVEDVQMAADLFRPTYGRLEGRDSLVSLEVNPHLARDVQGSIAEARRSARKVGRQVIRRAPTSGHSACTCGLFDAKGDSPTEWSEQ